jgi:hypothetical protein
MAQLFWCGIPQAFLQADIKNIMAERADIPLPCE